ncbi:MAG: hypothetical protein A3J60_02165 [Candidatus Pacebacteria bacterium RIFCSPHIGHO2_02_FULL_46_9]|nr:MAG: hypothetical protein A3J60_02165 [Candidatus Pacebacteria bacterium RIFCSPHIGHO2_02_FULL_46_9]
MTICIAAISEKKKVVSITDKMLTLEEPVRTTYEISDNNKVIPLNDTVVALFAGDVIHANEILELAKQNLVALTPVSVREIAEIVNQAFSQYWENLINNFLQRRFKISHQQFMHNQGSFDGDLVKQISQIIAGTKIGVEIVVAGVHGEDENAHIFTMDHMGTVVSQDPIGYACIGSGSRHATLSLIESEISNQTVEEETLFALLKAKRRAEYDPGVGKLCDIVVVRDSVVKFTEAQVKQATTDFDSFISEQNKAQKKAVKELKKLC